MNSIPMDSDTLRIFAGRASRAFGELCCRHLRIPLGNSVTEVFPDGELLVKLNEDVRGRDCYVIQSTCAPVNDNLVELFIYMDCLRRASAKRITAVIPYFGYARQDRKDEGRTPITAKMVANLLVESGVQRVLTLDLHAPQIQGFFDIPVDHLTAAPVFVEYFRSIRESLGEISLVSPDVGNVKVANMYANILGGDLAIIDKRRHSGRSVSAVNLIGEVKDRTVLMFDDMISTAGTICEAAKFVMERGAKRVIVSATHAVLVGPAIQRLVDAPIEKVVLTDSIPLGDRARALAPKLVELSVTPLIGEAIHRIHSNISVSALFKDGVGTRR